jgi:hypothetical protein
MAALESAVQLGRGNEVNRQAEMAKPTKRGDSLQGSLNGEATLQRALRIPWCHHDLGHQVYLLHRMQQRLS